MEKILRELDEAMKLIQGVMETLDPDRKPGKLRLTKKETRDAHEAIQKLKKAGVDLPLDLVVEFSVVAMKLDLRGYEVTLKKKPPRSG